MACGGKPRRFQPVLQALVVAALLGSQAASAASASSESGKHWAFRPITRPAPPPVKNASWPRQPIDNFILAELESRQLEPAPRAKPEVLLRRASLDTIGLPLAASEGDAFVGKPSDEAYFQLVEKLLANPHYGERWGRHWLDVARYADSAGYEFDTKREVWKYRDWVIDAINRDLPYNQFIIEQFAGDLLPNATREQRIATGFSCNALKQYGDVHETTIDRVNAFGEAVLGLTVGCAVCHDHKFDPLSQKEYYQLYAFFNDAEDTVLDLSPPEVTAVRDALKQQIESLKKEQYIYQNGPDPDPFTWAAQLTPAELRATPSELRQAIIRVASDRSPEQIALIREGHANARLRYQDSLEDRIDAWAAALSDKDREALPEDAKKYLSLSRSGRSNRRPPSLVAKFWEKDAGLAKRKEIMASLEKSIPPTETTEVLHARVDHPKTHVFLRGNHLNLGDEVQPDTPSILPPLAKEAPHATRLDLARWAASRENPLTARVIVNRVWQAYFGKGLVETSEDFGVQAPQPRYLALLDWLASELMNSGWSLKHIHRLILTSAVYQQSSDDRAELQELDPQNQLFARQDRLRLEAEIIRDQPLSVSGLLNERIGGRSVFPYQAEGVMTARADGTEWHESQGADRYRRGMYTHYWRTTPHPFLTLFDFPDAAEACTRRSRSNTPVQALTLLNDPSFVEAAVALARRMADDSHGATDAESVAWAFKECLGRTPSPDEQAVLVQLLGEKQAEFAANAKRAQELVAAGQQTADAARIAAFTSVARTLLNLDEFITRE
jgi:hypothetical protein